MNRREFAEEIKKEIKWKIVIVLQSPNETHRIIKIMSI
jgi:hypothetical protein